MIMEIGSTFNDFESFLLKPDCDNLSDMKFEKSME